ncbi:SH3 domain-containing protein [Montanilutibacter psychrotolerans]|uniref:Peptide-binding protein n=1 Tax=Montanilutibacter psychrotolerans TaxID=1327343 RepID=A0A3M8T147_9GAMM|nr:SH3 domain-containing protein [Lysobacter psychrotolerans]RNF84412.1 peptide-binding protein [Lysobacter psychrotolerans]
MRRARVVVAHRAPDRPAIRVRRGDAVVLGNRDRDWPQFVWTVVEGGNGGWVPAELFDTDHGRATALADYDTRELDADADQVVQLHHEMARWWWAEDDTGAQGWIPERALELLDAPASGDNPT